MNELKKFFQKFKVESIIAGILAIVVGILFVVLPESSYQVLCTVAGVLLIVGGIVTIICFIAYGGLFAGHLLILGISLFLSGIFCLVYPEIVRGILTIVFGIYIIVDGATSVVDSVYCARARISGWFILLLLSLVTICLGTIVMFGDFDTIMIFAGCSLIIDGVCDIVEICVFSHKVREAKKRIIDETNIIDM